MKETGSDKTKEGRKRKTRCKTGRQREYEGDANKKGKEEMVQHEDRQREDEERPKEKENAGRIQEGDRPRNYEERTRKKGKGDWM